MFMRFNFVEVLTLRKIFITKIFPIYGSTFKGNLKGDKGLSLE